jgi:hypothetical protein
MGYEAYKITAKFHNVTLEEMIKTLSDDGAFFIEKFGGTATMEVANSHGYIDLVLRECCNVNVRFSPCDKVQIIFRFAKVNDSQILDSVISLLRGLAARYRVVYIRDQETGKDIDLADTAWLRKAVAYAKYDFEYYYVAPNRNVRCRDVFCHCGSGLPATLLEELR